MAHPLFDFSGLSPEERIQLAEDLWDSLVPTPEAVLLPEAHARELDRRIEAYRRDGDRGVPWREALDEIEAEDIDTGQPEEDRSGRGG